jgi:hypothetical protein
LSFTSNCHPFTYETSGIAHLLSVIPVLLVNPRILDLISTVIGIDFLKACATDIVVKQRAMKMKRETSN